MSSSYQGGVVAFEFYGVEFMPLRSMAARGGDSCSALEEWLKLSLTIYPDNYFILMGKVQHIAKAQPYMCGRVVGPNGQKMTEKYKNL